MKRLLAFTALATTCILAPGCGTTLNDRNRQDMSAQPPRFEAPYDQIPQKVDDQYVLNYEPTTLSDTQNGDPKPINIYPDNYQTNTGSQNSDRNGARPLEGIPAPNKEGFVISPYSPNSGLIDVREFPAGVEVRDPYTGRVMLVPTKTDKPTTNSINKDKNITETGSSLLKRGVKPKPKQDPSINPVVQQAPSNVPTAPTVQQGPNLMPK